MAARVLFVTGKGGSGKTTLARALARAAAERGLAVVSMRVASASDPTPQAAGPLPASPPHDATEIVLDERRCLEGLLTGLTGISVLSRRLMDSRTFSAVAAAAPGLRDLATLSAIVSQAERHRRGRAAIVVDAPASGHSVPLLAAPGAVLGATPLGPVARVARRVEGIVTDPARFQPIVVTLAEELAATETLTLHRDLLRAGFARPRVVANALWPAHAGAPLGRWLETSGASLDALRHWKRSRRQAQILDALEAELGAVMRVPFSFAEGEISADAVATVLDSVVEEDA